MLCVQCIGRGLRPHPGKSDCIVIDLTDYHHDLSAPLSLGDIWCCPPTAPNMIGVGDDWHIGGDRTTAKGEGAGASASQPVTCAQLTNGWRRLHHTRHILTKLHMLAAPLQCA